MARSTANFVSYDIRPAKQSERRIILDILKTAGDSGLPISTYRYIGMGANRFYDFLLVHKYIGIASMISLEHDPQMFDRANFNCPYGFIDVLNKSSTDFIAEDSFNDSSVIWFDYDGGIGPHIINDISALSTKLKVGDFCFVTLYGGPPGVLDKENNSFRLNWFYEVLGDVAGDLTIEDVEKSAFSNAVFKTLTAAFRNAFSFRRDGTFVICFKVRYVDSKPMVTIGGALLSEQRAPIFEEKFQIAFPFLNNQSNSLYEIKSFHLTERERALFDRASTAKPRFTSDKNKLNNLGFRDSEIAAYKELIRYLPRYVETMV
jgi:hypothetical protein